jgi:Ca2+-binding RTX toxin-like protein
MEDVNLWTTVDYLDDIAWLVNLNTGNDTFYGNDFDDIIKAGAGNDAVFGYGGDDDLFGGSGNDRLSGGADSDFLVGGFGKDILRGGEGFDFFDFNSRKESVVGANRDSIVDFARGHDRLDLRTIDADIDGTAGNQAFKWIGTKAFTGVDGQLRMSGCILQGDVNGDRKADFEIKINVQLYSSDILL